MNNETTTWIPAFSTTKNYVLLDGKTNSTLPICEEILCRKYWQLATIINWIDVIFRMSISVLIFLLGTKMQKDFIRSVTVAIFCPIFFAECFNLYVEMVGFRLLFCTEVQEMIDFDLTYVNWTSQLVTLLVDYNQFNCLILHLLLLHCCRLATKPGDHINLFPMNSICGVLQIIPFFVSFLIYLEQGVLKTPILVISFISRVVTVAGFIALVFLILISVPLLFRELPYGHAGTPDIQLMDARSRLAWTLVYMVVPLLTMIPTFAESIAWISVMGHTTNGKDKNLAEQSQVFLVLVKRLVNYYRPTWLVIITMAFLPPYRRAVPLLFMSCSFCPQIKVEAVPRRPKETSTMYRYAD